LHQTTSPPSSKPKRIEPPLNFQLLSHLTLHPVASPSTQQALRDSRLAVIIGDNTSLALSTAAAPASIRDGARLRVAAVEGIVDLAAVGGVGGGLELVVGVACVVLMLVANLDGLAVKKDIP